MLEPVHSMRGKLPSLHRIGKTKCIDEDEPPPIHDLSFDPVPFALLEDNRFDVSDAEETLRALRRAFCIVCPGRHACKRSFDHSGLNITHCRDGVGLGKYYLQLQKIMEKRAWLEFTHDWMYRVKSTLLFIQELESMVYTEYCTLYDIMHNNQLPQDIESKLCGLNSICEDLRVHSNHWNSIQQRIRTQQWMQPLLSSVYSELKMLKKVFFQLQDATIWWIHKLIEIGLVVFSHSQMSHVSNEVFWSVARGLEDFNSIVTSAKLNAFHDNESIIFKDPNLMAMWNSIMINSKFHNLSSLITISPISLNHILNCFANQRSRYATFDTHRFLTKSDEFIDNLDTGTLPGFVWNDLSANIMSAVSSESFEHQIGNGSASLSTVILNVNSLKAPDLSVLMSPLTDFVRREQDFAEKFLSVICNSTNFLRYDNTNNSSTKDNKGVTTNRLTARRFSGTPVLSRTDSRRKTVSWGDTANSSIKSQLVATYLENIWQNFGKNFEHLIYEPAWNGERSLMRTDVGSLFLVNDTLVLMLCRMIYHGIVKDLFPSGSVIPLQILAQKIHTIAAIGCWDNCVCKVEGLRTVDKCYPCPLGNGDYSTKTGLLLKDTYQPLLSSLENCIQSLNSTGPESTLQKSVTDPTQILSLFTRLQTTACIALSWCYSKTHEFLASWSIGSFILVTQTDLKILSDETKRAVCIAQTLCTNLSLYNSLHNAYIHSALTEVYHELEDINSQLQSLSGSVMKLFSENCGKISKQFFQNNMPGGKIWRSKSVGRFNDYTIEQQDYIEHALETILEPVVEGVSKLRVTSQLSVISMATVAMCEAWTDFILKEKIKFSLHGAHQLGADFNFVRTWLSSAIRNNEVRQSITQLSVFSYLNGIVLLLQRQPKKRASTRFTDPCANDDIIFGLRPCCGRALKGLVEQIDISSDTADSNTESNHRGANCESSTETEVTNDEKDICSVSNTDDWLALRVCGGSRTWKFPSCFNIQREDT
ncbi:uncharacterized protein LOC106868655 isoform X1 [Octopus bimaculoides]|uniref:uncharacterized protein LOC106868655 isoform X1 n=1 Tax=Octopus bimaculoides TaxID=37653 RepID=UPI0022E52C38|nr:uncharacterized protein LOC106868655 isoform X1 [Octopus bimaculoides]XP_052830533.1 uncharacterized protein LOC106868655 isoform X1 [Octopus bimaculoides]XP_052830534.1 uncharacterized protein LOC106868655 isoform X1 [Octopus bimaculoides]